MYRLSASGLRRTLGLSVSALALFAASTAALTQPSDNASPPPAAVTPQAPAASPTPEASPSPQTTQPGVAPSTAEQPPAPSGPNVLPTTRVAAPKERPRPRVRPPQVATNRPPAPPTQEQVVTQQNEKLDSARNNIFPPVGANSYEVTHRAIESLPQGTNTTLDKVLLQVRRHFLE